MQNIVMNIVKLQIKAFTLLETLLVLMITSFLILLFSGTIGNTIHIIRGELFIARFENSYKNVQFQASADAQTLVFSASDQVLTVGAETVAIPEEAKVTDFSVKFDKYGNNSSLKKIIISLPYESKTVSYQMEMGSGKYKKTVQ